MMIIYYVIYCSAAISSTYYSTALAAEKAARLYTNISGHEWKVRKMIGTINKD